MFGLVIDAKLVVMVIIMVQSLQWRKNYSKQVLKPFWDGDKKF
jgi:hypothetical protein